MEGHDKLVKALDKATKAVPKAETALAKAANSVDTARAAVVTADTDVRHATAVLDSVEAEVPPSPPTVVTAQTPATDPGELAEHLPESFAHRQDQHPHESPWTMTFPLVVLSLFAVVAGAINLPFTSDLHFLGHWLEPSLFGHEAELTASAGTKWVLAVIAVLVGVVAIAAAFSVYLRGRSDPAGIEREPLARAWFVDESYAAFMGGPGRMLFDLAAWFDRTIIDGAVRGAAVVVSLAGRGLRVTQPGFVRSYALGIGVGAAFVMVWFLGRLFA